MYLVAGQQIYQVLFNRILFEIDILQALVCNEPNNGKKIYPVANAEIPEIYTRGIGRVKIFIR
jgi:hypothetical protein